MTSSKMTFAETTLPETSLAEMSLAEADSTWAGSQYRPAARHAQPIDTSMSHVGFRCITREMS
jgi:formylglycine-generating enzyme required for sulfatase activity